MEALSANALAGETPVFVYLDGPKSESDQQANQKIRDICKNLMGFESVSLVCRDSNFGLAESIISGVTEMCEAYGQAIILEDDLLTSPHFLRFMNDGLRTYAEERRVASIHGYVYPIKNPLPETFFLRGADCWGWATWKRAWETFEKDGRRLLLKLKELQLEDAFDFGGAGGNTAMLQGQVDGNINSWAIRWHASTFIDDMLTLYPGRSLIKNTGNDGSGTHCLQSSCYDVSVSSTAVSVEKIALSESSMANSEFRAYFKMLKSNPDQSGPTPSGRSYFSRLFSLFKR